MYLARRLKMASRKLAGIALRPRSLGLIAATVIVAQATFGCSHHRTSYRPIYAAPAVVAAPPCNGYGPDAAIAPAEPAGAPSSSVPLLPEPPGPAVGAPPAGAPPAGAPTAGTGATRDSTVEAPPKSRIGNEPSYDEFPPAPSGGTNRNSSPKSSSDGSGPSLLAPNSSPSALNDTGYDSVPSAAVNPKRVRRASLTERLRPFVDDTSAKEIAHPSKADRPWKYIVLHHSAAPEGGYDQIDREHRKMLGFDGCGYHFVIGNGTGSADGQIEVAMRWDNQKQGVHCRNAKTHDADEYGIGICLVGDFDQQPPTPRQVAAAQALIAYLSQRYNISAGRVTTHAHLAATPTVCPGKYFPTQSMLAAAKDANRLRGVRTTWTSASVSTRSN
jgi:hypothetical protein